MDKKSLRKVMIEKRNKILKEDKKTIDKTIMEKLKNSKYYKESKNIFIYLGFGSEIDTISYIEDLISDGKNIFIPRTYTKNKKMEAVQITSLEGLEKNKYGILEPNENKKEIDKENLDIVILPGVAFDYKGKRIGYGGGYYDRYLEDIENKVKKVALVYDFQILESVPAEEHDVKADYIITEKQCYKCI